jgi:hypothetical protein
MRAEVVYEASDGKTRVCGIFEFDALPVAGDHISVPLDDKNTDTRFWTVMVRAYHLPRKRPTDGGSPQTRILVRDLD